MGIRLSRHGRHGSNEPPGTLTLRHLHLSLRITHRIVAVLFGTLVFALVLLSVLVWRLAQGPLALDFLAPRLESALKTDGTAAQIRIGGIALAWEGFNRGLDRPIDLRLREVSVVDESGRRRLEIPRAAVTLSVAALLIGRIIPRAIELDGVRLTVTRGRDDTIGVDVGDLADSAAGPPRDTGQLAADWAELMQPVSADWLLHGNILSQLRLIRMSDLGMRIEDRKLGVTWTVPRADFDLVRRGGGGIDAAGSASIQRKDQHTTATLTATSSADRSTLHIRFMLGDVVPAALDVPGLDALHLPMSAEGTLELSPALSPLTGTMTLSAGAGAVHIRTGDMPVRSASVTVDGTPDALTIRHATLVLPGSDGQPDATLSLTGTARRGPQRLTADATLLLDHVAFVDLPRLWPTGLGGGARPWITENMTAGTAHDGRIDVALEADSDFSNLTLTRATGVVDADNMTVRWMTGMPPAEQGHARIRLVDADTIDITMTGGVQRVGSRTPLVLTGGSMHITGLSVKDQDADIAVQAKGPLADAIALLREPRLKLLSAHPIDLREPAGDATVAIKVRLPLESWITLDDVGIGVTAQVHQGHLTGVAAGRDLDKAELEIAADKDRLTLKGVGQLGGIATKIDGLMDFQANRPSDVAQRITVTGKPSVAQLAAAGLDARDVLSGEIPLSAVWSKQVGGDGDIVLDADLTGTKVTVPPLAWQKPAGEAVKASARLRLSKDRLRGIDPIVASGPGVMLRASADANGETIISVRLDRLVLGGTDVSGTIGLPPGGAVNAVINGPTLDMAAKLVEKTPPRDPKAPEPPPGRPWNLTGTFGRVLLANDVTALHVQVEARNDGRIFPHLRIAGTTQPAAAFSIGIAMEKGGRRMTMSAADAGAILRGLDAIHAMQSGSLTLTGVFDDSRPTHPLTGTAEIVDFRIRGAPALGRLLQAMTLYGLVDVVSGPGLAFARLSAPFVLSDSDLELGAARAFSPSLGLTVTGHIDMQAETANLEGTIVPAYFFNSLLGRIPFVGRLFRAEEGGGLFAARYTIKGPLSDPSVFVNPLSMLTPGFLRGVFGIF